MANKQLSYTAERVDELLRIVDGLGEATTTEAGLMSAEDKAKLDSVEDGAEENVIVGVQVGGSALTPANKVVNIPADSAPTSESTNLVRSGGVYAAIQQVANALLNYYTKAQVDALLAGVHQFTYQVVAELPSASADTMYILYFVPSSDPQTQNVKDEYITIRTGSEGAYAYSWERIGSTEIDLSDYPTTEEMNAAITAAVASKADKDDDAVEGNLAKFDANGNPVDAGIAAEKVAKKGEVQTFAGNLVDTRSAGTRQQFAFRQSGGDGVNYMRKILGRTEAWNQLCSPITISESSFTNGVKVNTDGNAVIVEVDTGGATATRDIGQVAQYHYGVIGLNGHKRLFYGAPQNAITAGIKLLTGYADITPNSILTETPNAVYYGIRVPSGTPAGTYVFYPQVTSLTLLGRDDLTSAEFLALHPLPYYNYNAGVLKNNAATGLETTGFNQWDEVSESGAYDTNGQPTPAASYIRSKNPISAFPNTTYYLKAGSSVTVATAFFYDAEGNFISYTTGNVKNATFATPSNCHYIHFCVNNGGATYNHDICINLSDPDRNGEYEPYWKREIVLGLDNLACHDEQDNAVVVNGLDGVGTAQDELIVENGWGTKINKNRARVDLGSLAWGYSSAGCFYATVPSLINQTSGPTALICLAYATDPTANSTLSSMTDKTVRQVANTIGIKDSDAGTDAVAFKAAMAGVYLDYPLATPKVLTLDNPIPALIEVDSLGTEKRLPEDTADNPQGPFESDSNYSISVANLVRKLNS